MKYEIEIDDTLGPLCEAATENMCESRNPDGSIYQTRYGRGFVDRLQELASQEADRMLALTIAQGPATLLPENIKTAAKSHQDAVAAVAATQDAIVSARKDISGMKEKPLVVVNEPPKPIVVEPPIEEPPIEPLPVERVK